MLHCYKRHTRMHIMHNKKNNMKYRSAFFAMFLAYGKSMTFYTGDVQLQMVFCMFRSSQGDLKCIKAKFNITF